MCMLELQNVSYHNILHDINLQVKEKDFLIVLGHNGSGKSTLFNLVHQHLQPTYGEIYFSQKPYRSYRFSDYHQQVILMRQHAMDHLCLQMTIFEHVKLFSMRCKDPKAQRLTSDARALNDYLVKFCKKFPDKLHLPVMNLSGGEQQMLVLALNLLRKPKMLLLDEHTAALDPKTCDEIMQITASVIEEFAVTCVLITHNLEVAKQYGNRLAVMQGGCVSHQFDRTQKQQLMQGNCLRDIVYQ